MTADKKPTSDKWRRWRNAEKRRRQRRRHRRRSRRRKMMSSKCDRVDESSRKKVNRIVPAIWATPNLKDRRYCNLLFVPHTHSSSTHTTRATLDTHEYSWIEKSCWTLSIFSLYENIFIVWHPTDRVNSILFKLHAIFDYIVYWQNLQRTQTHTHAHMPGSRAVSGDAMSMVWCNVKP